MKKTIIIFMVMMFFIVSFATADITSMNAGAVKYWALEDLTDNVGGADLNNYGATSGATGVIGNSYSFDGTNDHMNISYISEIAGVTEYTINFWIKRDTTTTKDVYYYYWGSNPNVIGLEAFTDGKFYLTNYDGATGRYATWDYSGLSASTWYMITVAYDGAGATYADRLKLYVDADLKTLTFTGVIGTISPDPLGGFDIGSRVGIDRFVDGDIDEFSIFDVTLEQTDIDFLYDSGSPNSQQQYIFSTSATTFTTNHLTPVNNTVNNTLLNISYSVTDTTNTQIDCSLYINNTLNYTNSNIVVNTTIYISQNLSNDGDYNYNVSCTNGTLTSVTAQRLYTYDNTQPFIDVSSPNIDNSTTFNYTNRNLVLDINVWDQHLYKGNLTIYNSTGAVMYNNYTGDITGNITWDWNSTINMSTWTVGLYSGFAEFVDLHTAKSIKGGFKPIKEKPKKIKYKTPKEWGETEFSLEYTGNTKLLSYNDNKKFDRHSIRATFDKTKDKTGKDKTGKDKKNKDLFRWEEFLIVADKKLKYIESSEFPCHIVSKEGMQGLWFDCVYTGMENDIQEVVKISDYEYKLNIYTDNEIIEFNSLGGLNYNNKSFSFNILENLTITANDTNTGLLIQNFTVNYNSINYIATGENITILVYANQTNSFEVSKLGYQTYINSTFVGFTPKNLLVNLTSGGTVLNFYDEETNSLILETITIDMVGNISGRFNTSVGGVTITGLTDGNYEAVYSANGYFTRGYPIVLNGTGIQTIDLYMLNSSLGENIVANVLDGFGNPLTNYVINMLRLVDGEYKLVEVSTTNYLGKTGLSGRLYTPYYKFRIENDGTIYLNSDETEIFDTEIDFFIASDTVVGDLFRQLGDLDFNLDFSTTTNKFTLDYDYSGVNFEEIRLNVYNLNDMQLVASNISTSATGVINVDLTGLYVNGSTYLARAEFNNSDEFVYIDSNSHTYPAVTDNTLTEMGIFGTIIIIITLLFIGFWNPAIMLILEAIAVILTRVVNFHQLDWTIVTAVTVACLLGAYIISDRA